MTLLLSQFSVYRGRTPIVDRLELSLEPGEVVALLGRSGAGRTTFLEGLAGVLPSRGEVCMNGASAGTTCRERLLAGISLSIGRRGLFPELTVAEHLRLGASAVHDGRQSAAVAEQSSLAPILAQRSAQRAGTLSGGEQQLLALVVALSPGPRVLLLDDPTAGLAPPGRDALGAILRRYLADPGTACVIADDHLEFVLSVATRVLLLRDGRIRLDSPVDPRWTPADVLELEMRSERSSDAREERR